MYVTIQHKGIAEIYDPLTCKAAQRECGIISVYFLFYEQYIFVQVSMGQSVFLHGT